MNAPEFAKVKIDGDIKEDLIELIKIDLNTVNDKYTHTHCRTGYQLRIPNHLSFKPMIGMPCHEKGVGRGSTVHFIRVHVRYDRQDYFAYLDGIQLTKINGIISMSETFSLNSV